MTTELAAIRDAIILVGRVCKPGENFIICTDSMSGIQAIINPDIKDNIFTTAHYLIECPVTMNNNNKVLQLLEPGDFSLPAEDQAAIILRKSDNKEYNSLIELINKHPPASYCEQHP